MTEPEPPPAENQPAPDTGPPLFALLATAAVLLLVGMVLGAVGAFLVPLRWSGERLPVSVAIAGAGNLAAGFYGVRLLRSRVGALPSGIGWFATVLPLGASRPEGDLVVPGDGVGVAFLLVGAVAAAVAVGLAGGHRSPQRAGLRGDG